MKFQENLRFYREEKGYSAIEFSKMLNVPYPTYKGYENQGREPKYDTLCKIASLLNVSVDELLGYNTKTTKEETLLKSNIKDLERTINELLNITKDEQKELYNFIDFKYQLGNIDEKLISFNAFFKDDIKTIKYQIKLEKDGVISFIENINKYLERFKKLIFNIVLYKYMELYITSKKYTELTCLYDVIAKETKRNKDKTNNKQIILNNIANKIEDILFERKREFTNTGINEEIDFNDIMIDILFNRPKQNNK